MLKMDRPCLLNSWSNPSCIEIDCVQEKKKKILLLLYHTSLWKSFQNESNLQTENSNIMLDNLQKHHEYIFVNFRYEQTTCKLC